MSGYLYRGSPELERINAQIMAERPHCDVPSEPPTLFDPDDWDHGLGGYTNHGCRCDICRDGNAEWMRTYRAMRKQGYIRRARA